MAFRGVFIGIDKYCDPRAQELTAARRDATALWALFIDTIPRKICDNDTGIGVGVVLKASLV